MTESAVALVLLSAAIHAGWNALSKASRSPGLFNAAKGLPQVAVCLAVAVALDVRTLPVGVLAVAMVSGVIHAAYLVTLSRSYQAGDLSFVYPIVRSAPAFVPLGAWLLIGETLSLQGVAGIAIVVAAIVLLQLRSGEAAALAALPASLLRPESRWALATLALVVTYTLVDKYGMTSFRASGVQVGGERALSFFAVQLLVCYPVYWTYTAVRGPRGFGALLRAEWGRALLAGAAAFSSYLLILYVMESEEVSYIVTLRQASILIAALIGWLVLGERQGSERLGVSLILVVGLALVATA